MRSFLLSIFFLFQILTAESKSFTHSFLKDSTQKKINRLAWIGGGSYVGAMTLLGITWYGQSGMGNFHFFNDNKEWKQMDKLGHFYTTFHLTNAITNGLENVGMKKEKALFWAATSSSFMMLNIELLDGFSRNYGASWGDFLANTTGAFFSWGQYKLWNEVRIHPKFSFYPSGLAPLRPNLLGKTLAEQFIKDYNAQTYWYSVDVNKFLPKISKFPKWLNLSLGYAARPMIFAEDEKNINAGFYPYRRFFIGIDFDVTSIKTNKKWVKKLLYVVNMFRLPAPTLEYNEKGNWNWFWLYF